MPIDEEIPVSNSSVAVQCHIRAFRGDKFLRTFRYWLDAAKNLPRNIMSSTILFEVINPKTKNVVLDFTLDDGLTRENVQDLIAEKSEEDMLIPPGTYTYRIKIDEVTRQYGQFIIDGDC